MGLKKVILSLALLMSISAFAEDPTPAPDTSAPRTSTLGQLSDPTCESENGSAVKVLDGIQTMNAPTLKAGSGDQSKTAN